jgi:hypothetical protein
MVGNVILYVSRTQELHTIADYAVVLPFGGLSSAPVPDAGLTSSR